MTITVKYMTKVWQFVMVTYDIILYSNSKFKNRKTNKIKNKNKIKEKEKESLLSLTLIVNISNSPTS